MSLYYDAATFFTPSSLKDGSLKSRIFKNGLNLKSAPATIYALISETAKYDSLLKEIIDTAGILALEPKLTPLTALFLVHDQLLSKKGIAANTAHPLRLAVERHKARLQAELTKCRIKRGCTSIEELKIHVAQQKQKTTGGSPQPRWIRVNLLKSTVSQQMSSTFAGYNEVSALADLVRGAPNVKRIYLDQHVPDLLALAHGSEVTRTPAYKNGEIILQDKASCFPAYMLVGDSPGLPFCGGDIFDACAAPGNKTTHLASMLCKQLKSGVSGRVGAKIFACERDPYRSKTLQTMITLAAAEEHVAVLAKQDFLALDPNAPRFRDVTHLLLDPSCSGSGIVGREDMPDLVLPTVAKRDKPDPSVANDSTAGKSMSKKRKRENGHAGKGRIELATASSGSQTNELESEEVFREVDSDRLRKLATLQSKIIEHAFSFPSATRITYSTCSIHVEENEEVVARALQSDVASTRAWRVLRRDEQVSGLKKWEHRGIAKVNGKVDGRDDEYKWQVNGLSEEERQACIRCQAVDGEGTMGFFVCGFIRDDPVTSVGVSNKGADIGSDEDDRGDEEWGGFSDKETSA